MLFLSDLRLVCQSEFVGSWSYRYSYRKLVCVSELVKVQYDTEVRVNE